MFLIFAANWRNKSQQQLWLCPPLAALNLIRFKNLYSPKNTVSAVNKQKQQIGLYTYIGIA